MANGCTWDGDLGEWMDIGIEFADSIYDHDTVTITSEKIK